MQLMDTMKVLRALLVANIPVKLESLPGAGKTSVLNSLFSDNGGYLHPMVAVTHDPTDFGGIPHPDLNVGLYRLLPGEWAWDLAEAIKHHSMVGLFLDEINTAGRTVLAACLKVVDERRIGNFQLPPSVRIMLAVNPAEANGGVDLTPAMANRVAHLPFEFPLDLWLDGLVEGFPTFDPIPQVAEEDVRLSALPFARSIASFLKANPAWVDEDAYPQDILMRSKAWPSRRTWTMAIRAAGAASAIGEHDVSEQLMESLVGAQAANAYADWQERTSIALEPLFNDPSGAPLPEQDDALFATLLKLVEETKGSAQEDKVIATCTIMARVLEDRPGIAAESIQSLAAWLMTPEGQGFTSHPKVAESLLRFAPIIQANQETAGAVA